MSRSDGNGAVEVMDDSRRAAGAGWLRPFEAWAWAARTRWVRRRALVTGPTPPGTGVIADTTRARRLEVHVADELVADDVDPDVHDHRARAQHLPGDQARDAGGHDHDLGVAGMPGEVDGLRVADRDGGVLAQQQQRRGLADHVRPADDGDPACPRAGCPSA